MVQYCDPENRYSVEYPDEWLPLTQEGSSCVSLASLATGGYLRLEVYTAASQDSDALLPEGAVRALIRTEQQTWQEAIDNPSVQTRQCNGARVASTTFTRRELPGDEHAADFGHARVWVFTRGQTQVRCLYRCRSDDRGADDPELDAIISSLMITDRSLLDAVTFSQYYFSCLKHHRDGLATQPPQGLSLTLPDGQIILLEHLYNHYLLEPERMDELIDAHIQRLDYCGDDVPDLKDYKAIRSLLFPKIFRARQDAELPPYRIPFWPGLAIGAVVQGRVFTYGVNSERLAHWNASSLEDLMGDLLDNLYAIPPVSPRGLRSGDGETCAISYIDHPFSASFTLFEDFYETTAQNLDAQEFLVGMPDPSCVSCFRDDDPRFVVQHTALLRCDYHRSVERLSDAIFLVSGPERTDVRPYDVLHCCPKKA